MLMNTTTNAAANDTTAKTFTADSGAVAEVVREYGYGTEYQIGELTIDHSIGRSIRVTDRTNAGRRGLTCPSIVLWADDGSITYDRLSDAVQAASVGFGKVVEVFEFLKACERQMGICTSSEKGVHTRPSRFNGFAYSDDKIAVSVEFDSFNVSDLTDPWNEPRTIPRGTADRNKCPKLAKALRAHGGPFSLASIRQIMASVGIKGHSYCAVD